jgi:hypothetical protein
VSTDASYHTRIGVVIRKEDVLLSEPRWLDPLVQHMLVAARRDRHVKTTLCGVSRFDLATLNGLKPTSWNPYDLVVVSATNVEKMLDVKGLEVDERDAARARALPDEFGFSKFGVGFVTLSSTGAMYYSPRDVPRTLAAPALTATPGEFVDLEAYEREARFRAEFNRRFGRGPDQTSKFSSSVTSKSIRLILGRIDGSRRVLEAKPKRLRRDCRVRSH